MKYLNSTSLFETIDKVSEALLFDLEIDYDEKLKIADFIATQQGKPNSYANTFAPTETDLLQDLILFTGERVKSRVGKCHITPYKELIMVYRIKFLKFYRIQDTNTECIVVNYVRVPSGLI